MIFAVSCYKTGTDDLASYHKYTCLKALVQAIINAYTRPDIDFLVIRFYKEKK